MKKLTFKIISLLLIAVMSMGFFSCEARPITSSKQALASVGTVGEYNVPYEEFYCLVHNYMQQLDVKYEDSPVSDEKYAEELRTLVYNNVVSNYAVLTLASKEGITLDSEDIKKDVQVSIEATITSDFDGKRSKYKKSMKENGLTDSYVRFSYGVDAVYAKLVAEYLDNGVINDDDEYIRSFIEKEFACTWHIMIVNDGTDASLDRVKQAKALLDSGKSMEDVIGSTYNDDFLMPYEGYYFPRNTMSEAYEEAAFALEVGEISDIVASEGKDSSGNVVDCYYIIQRRSIDKTYVESNYDELKEMYYGAAVYSMVSELQKTLKFIPNDYCKSLDILSLEAPKTVDYVVVVTVSLIAVVVLTVACACFIATRKIRKKNADIIGGMTNKELRAPKSKF